MVLIIEQESNSPNQPENISWILIVSSLYSNRGDSFVPGSRYSYFSLMAQATKHSIYLEILRTYYLLIFNGYYKPLSRIRYDILSLDVPPSSYGYAETAPNS